MEKGASMDDFGMLARNFGVRPQGKSAPMASSKSDFGVRSDVVGRSSSSRDGLLFNDVFGGPPKYTTPKNSILTATSDFDYDSIFNISSVSKANNSKNRSSSPLNDKPVYDEDIFDGLPGLNSKSTSSSVRYDDDVFARISSPRNHNQSKKQVAAFDDLIGNLGRTKNSTSSRSFDDLLPGFGSNRPLLDATRVPKTTINATQVMSDVTEAPFIVSESNSTAPASSPRLFDVPLEGISKPSNSGNTKISSSSVSGGVFDDIDPLVGFENSVSASSSGMKNKVKEESPSRTGSNIDRSHTSYSTETIEKSSFNDSVRHSQTMYADNFLESHVFDMPSVSTDTRKSAGQTAFTFSVNAKSRKINSQVEDVFPGSDESMESSDDIWITVSEIPLFTQPTIAPPPSRLPPIPARVSKSESWVSTSNARKKGMESSYSHHSTQSSQIPRPTRPPVKGTVVSQIDELEDFVMGKARSNDEENEEVNTNSSSAAAASASAMKEAMDSAEAKFKHAKEVREREYAKTSRSKDALQLEKDEQSTPIDLKRENREPSERLDHEWPPREEEEREKRRLEQERVKAREIERAREKAKQAVDRATREARERAATEARERAAAESRLKSERAAVHRVQAEARERAAVDARDRAEKAAADARERANAETRDKDVKDKAAAAAARAEADARRRTERAAVERAAVEAKERTAAAAAARTNQQKNDNDLESFFNAGSRPSSAPRPRENTYFQDPVPDPRFQNKGGPEGTRKTSSVGASSNMRKSSSATDIVDDLTSIFGAVPSSEEFQDVDGETEERRRARLERHQRTHKRAANALAEKNQRDLQTQRDQEERHRVAETLDVEIKRWAAGKEGNLRALLSTMQYVLWPECGWQPVSLTDLIIGASVKKVYRKATLCIHPDKVQQKGATLQQKYIAEKVFDLLKEAWNKFNSEELF